MADDSMLAVAHWIAPPMQNVMRTRDPVRAHVQLLEKITCAAYVNGCVICILNEYTK